MEWASVPRSRLACGWQVTYPHPDPEHRIPMPKYTPSAVLKSPDAQRDPLPPGRYPVKVAEVETTTTKAGDPRLKIIFAVEGHTEHTGAKVWDGFNLPSEGKPMKQVAVINLANLLAAVGDDDEFDTDSPDFAADLISRLTDQHLCIEVDHRTAPDGKTWVQVARDGYHKAEKSAAVAVSTHAVAKPKPVKAVPASPGWDEDIPF